VHRQRIEPMTLEAVEALTEAMPERYRALVTLAAGTGLRQGEMLGLTTDRIDFLRRQLTVDRQLITMPDRAPYLAPPKTQASVRVVPSLRSSSTPWRSTSPPGRPTSSSSRPSSATRSAARRSPSGSGARR
jgi:integrase